MRNDFWYGYKVLDWSRTKQNVQDPHICLRNICKDVTLILLYRINYSIWANINILTWMQLISIIDCIGIWKTRFHSSNNTKELVLKVRRAVKVDTVLTCFDVHRPRRPAQPVLCFRYPRQKWQQVMFYSVSTDWTGLPDCLPHTHGLGSLFVQTQSALHS